MAGNFPETPQSSDFMQTILTSRDFVELQDAVTSYRVNSLDGPVPMTEAFSLDPDQLLFFFCALGVIEPREAQGSDINQPHIVIAHEELVGILHEIMHDPIYVDEDIIDFLANETDILIEVAHKFYGVNQDFRNKINELLDAQPRANIEWR